MNTYAFQIKRDREGAVSYALSFDELVTEYNSFTQALDACVKGSAMRLQDAISLASRLNDHYNKTQGHTMKQTLWGHLNGRRSQGATILINSQSFLGNKKLFDALNPNARVQLLVRKEAWVSRKK